MAKGRRSPKPQQHKTKKEPKATDKVTMPNNKTIGDAASKIRTTHAKVTSRDTDKERTHQARTTKSGTKERKAAVGPPTIRSKECKH